MSVGSSPFLKGDGKGQFSARQVVILSLSTAIIFLSIERIFFSVPAFTTTRDIPAINTQQFMQPNMLQTQIQTQPEQGSILPPCEELMSRPNSPFVSGDFITREGTPYVWIPREDGSREFKLQSYCTLKRYTATEARRCLAGRHISFVGDSITRYQYLTLAYWIQNGQHPPRFPETGKPNVAAEASWKGWDDFFFNLGGGTDGGYYDGRMDCPAIRNTSSAENEVYISKPFEEYGNKRITLTVFQETGFNNDVRPLGGFNFTGCAESGTCRVTKEKQRLFHDRARNHSFDWEQKFPQAMAANEEGIIRQWYPQVDYAIYNRGLWGKLDDKRAEKIFEVLYDWTGNGKGRCFFRSTTAGRNFYSLNSWESGKIRRTAIQNGCSYLNFGYITSEFDKLLFLHPPPPGQENGQWTDMQERRSVYWDEVHFQPWVYEELNNVFMNTLCNWKYGKNETL